MNSKAQAWYMDFSIALLLFIFTLVVYFSYTANFQNQDKGDLDIMLTDAKAISSSLSLSGYPADWGNTSVVRIGLADEQKLNSTKVKSFKQYDYINSKKKFATQYDYVVFFLNNKGEVLNINGVCAIGYPLVNTTYNVKSAYYYQDPSDSLLKDFMNKTFNADIYFKDQNNDIYGLFGLIKNLSKYQLIMMEHPLLSGGDISSYTPNIENYTSNGGLLMISGELGAPSTNTMVGADFKKKSGQSVPQRTAVVNNTDFYLSFAIGQSMVFAQYYYVQNSSSSAVNFNVIATYNLTGDDSIARWQFGNGTVYFFSDFDVSNFNGDFIGVVQNAAKGLIQGTCSPINITGIPQKKLVKTERYLSYNDQVVKMVVYVWQ